MSQIQKKFLKANSVDESKILLLNNGAVRARNAADSADVELFKLDGSDKLQLLLVPQVSSDPVSGNDLVRKSHLDSEITTINSANAALEGRVTAIEDDYGVAGGLATLDGAGLVPSSQLPSYVDDVLEYANLAAFPATGETGKIYVAIDTGKCYRWSGSVYIQITSGAVDSVNGQTGIVVLDTEDVTESGDSRYYTAARQTAIEAYADAAVLVEKTRAELAESTIAGDLAQEILDRAADVDAEETRAMSAESVIAANLSQEILDRIADVDAEESRALAAEGVLQGLIDALEAASVQHVQEKFTLSAGDISNGYVTLGNLAITASINAFVDRLAIHDTDDYTVSTVGGVTRLTFVNSLVTPGQEKLSAGDVVRVKYAKVAIV